MRAIVRETLYRDIIGFIPVYSLVFAFGLWFGAFQLGWTWLRNLWLPAGRRRPPTTSRTSATCDSSGSTSRTNIRRS